MADKVVNHVMISYQWDCQKRMIKLRDKLKAAGYNVWMDINNMGGDTLACMAEAVENADALIICVSKKYQESKCCRKEAEYAFQKDKFIVPLCLEDGFHASGWLGLLMGTTMYYQAHSDEILEKVFPGVIRELGDKGKTTPTETWSPIKITEGSKALQCSVCLERFKNPKMLPCLHRFCEECLIRLAPRGTKIISCPICRNKASIPKDDVTQFPTDFHLKELVEEEAMRHQLTGKEIEFSCTCCDVGKQSKVVAKCQDCKHYICSSGLSAHQRFTGLRDHTLLIFEATDNIEVDKVDTTATSESTAKGKSEPKPKVNHWKIFYELYDEDHSINLLKYWIQQYDGDSQWQDQMVAQYLTCLTDLEESGIVGGDALANRQIQVAKVFKQAGRYVKAIELFEKIVEVEINEHGGREEHLADLYFLIGDVYSEMLNSVALIRDMNPTDVKQYIMFIRKSLKLRRKLKGDGQKYKLGYALRSVCHALRNWADYGGDSNLTAADAKTEAKKHIDEAIKIFTKLNAKGNVAKCILNKASLEERGSEEKEKLFRKALVKCEDTYGEYSVLSGHIYWGMFVLYHSRKDFYEAYKWLEKCREVRVKIYGEYHPHSQMVVDWLKRSIYVEIAKRTLAAAQQTNDSLES